MHDNQVGYLLGSLDDAEMRQVEKTLRDSGESQRQLALLKKALRPLAADRDDVAPPDGLAQRTLAKIAKQGGWDLPRAPRDAERAASSRSGWWRRADVLVVATLLILALGASSPLLYRASRQRGTLECQENLRQFFVGLTTYRDQHGAYPDLTRESPRNVAGLVVPVLADAGVLPGSFSIRCPEVGPPLSCALSLAQVRTMPPEDFQTQAPNFALCYAFALGYRDPAGGYHGPWQAPGSSWPILADRPPSDGSPGNSPNHGGTGQNVLFLDGHCQFVPQRTVGDPEDDIFCNHEQRVAAGIGAHDIVLGYSSARP
jgi:prepilin-type processing-associated H-X9-DG protein